MSSGRTAALEWQQKDDSRLWNLEELRVQTSLPPTSLLRSHCGGAVVRGVAHPQKTNELAIKAWLSVQACGPWEAEQGGQTSKHLSQLRGSTVESKGGGSSMERPHGRKEAEQQRARGAEWPEEVGLPEPLLNSSGCSDPALSPGKTAASRGQEQVSHLCRQPQS